MSSGSIDLAREIGIRSVAAAVIFAVVYFPLFLVFLWKSFRSPQYVHIVLALFCLVRVVSFSMRAAMAASTSIGSNSSVFEAEFILYNVGFFGVLYSAYILVLDRELLSPDIDTIHQSLPGPAYLLMNISRNGHFIRIILLVAVILGIVGVTEINGTSISSLSQGLGLRSAGIYIFLAVTALLLIQTILLFISEVILGGRKNVGRPESWAEQPGIGGRHGATVLLAIAALLLVREGFFAGTAHSFVQQNKEVLFYPLCALPEFLAVALLATPGLVPPRSVLPRSQNVGLVSMVRGRGAV